MAGRVKTTEKSIDELRKFFEDVFPNTTDRDVPSIPGSDEYVPSFVSDKIEQEKTNGQREPDPRRNQQVRKPPFI